MSIKKDFIIYSLMKCPYCFCAKSLLDDKNLKYFVYTVDLYNSFIEKNTLKENVSKLVNEDVKTFPIIFTTEMEFIGGYDDLEHYIHNLTLSDENDDTKPLNITSICDLLRSGCE